LVGAAGCGKTRLAVARDRANLAPDGAWFVSLTAVDDPKAVLSFVAETASNSTGGHNVEGDPPLCG
jgi:predicted ATPase